MKDLAEAERAYADLGKVRRRRTKLKDAVREGSLRPFHRAELIGPAAISLQQFIPGVAVNRAVVCHEGRVIAGRTFEAVETMPGNGHATVLRPRHIPAVEQAAQRCAALLGLSGVAGFDFIYDPVSGQAYLLEVNARATSGCYAAPAGTPPLARTLADFLIHSAGSPGASFAPEPVSVPEAAIVLFPHEIERDRRSPYLNTAGHLVPVHDPKLVQACLRHARRTPPVIRLSKSLKRLRAALAR